MPRYADHIADLSYANLSTFWVKTQNLVITKLHNADITDQMVSLLTHAIRNGYQFWTHIWRFWCQFWPIFSSPEVAGRSLFRDSVVRQ